MEIKHGESELTVITRAKELCMYVLAVTDKSPKQQGVIADRIMEAQRLLYAWGQSDASGHSYYGTIK